jgi:sporulation protein YlmC with PRC-barrel domain
MIKSIMDLDFNIKSNNYGNYEVKRMEISFKKEREEGKEEDYYLIDWRLV